VNDCTHVSVAALAPACPCHSQGVALGLRSIALLHGLDGVRGLQRELGLGVGQLLAQLGQLGAGVLGSSLHRH
jgi:hypothetical protein